MMNQNLFKFKVSHKEECTQRYAFIILLVINSLLTRSDSLLIASYAFIIM
jgi:hypothetical protein